MADDRRTRFEQLLQDVQEATRDVDRLARIPQIIGQENLAPVTVDEMHELQAALSRREGAEHRLLEFLQGGLPRAPKPAASLSRPSGTSHR